MLFLFERVRLELKLLSLIQQSFRPTLQNSETNRCREYNNSYSLPLFISEFWGAGLNDYWISDNIFNSSLTLFSIFYFDASPYPNIFLNSILKEGNLKKKISHYPTSIPSRPQLDVKLNKKPFTPTNQTWSDRNFPIGSGSLFIRV